MMVGQAAIIHHLQQDVEQVRMRLFDFVEQQHAMRISIHRIGEEAALIETDITRRRADQTADRMAFHIFGHVEPLQWNAHDARKLARHFGLADTGGARKQIVANRLVRIAQAGTAQLDRRGQYLDRLVLTEDDAFQVGFQIAERRAIIGLRRSWAGCARWWRSRPRSPSA